MYKFDNGILMIAYNNNKIDYAKLAMISAKLVKKNMQNNHVTLMTDKKTAEYLLSTIDAPTIKKTFNHIIVETIEHERNSRTHHDTPWTE